MDAVYSALMMTDVMSMCQHSPQHHSSWRRLESAQSYRLRPEPVAEPELVWTTNLSSDQAAPASNSQAFQSQRIHHSVSWPGRHLGSTSNIQHLKQFKKPLKGTSLVLIFSEWQLHWLNVKPFCEKKCHRSTNYPESFCGCLSSDRLNSNLCLKDSSTVIWNVIRPFLSSLTRGERRDQEGGAHLLRKSKQTF